MIISSKNYFFFLPTTTRVLENYKHSCSFKQETQREDGAGTCGLDPDIDSSFRRMRDAVTAEENPWAARMRFQDHSKS